CFMSPTTGNGDIYRANVDGTGCARLTSDKAIESHPVFSPTGDSITYLSQPLGYPPSRHVWIMDADGGHQRQVIYGDGYTYEITGFSEDGKQIYFERRMRFGPDLVDDVPMVVSLDGSRMAVDRRGDGGPDSKLRSPDGRFALELVDPEPSVPWQEIWIKD